MESYAGLVQKCDNEIRAGRPQAVAKHLARLNLMRIPRELRFPLAKICRRAGLYSLGMRILTPVVHQRSPGNEAPPSSIELAEYSMLLLRNGGVSEALSTLLTIDDKEVPESLLYRAMGHFALWQFQASIPLLETYIQRIETPYETLVGRMNLAFALVESRRHFDALRLLNENLQMAKEQGHLQLQNVCLAFRGQSHLLNEDLAAAERDLILAGSGDAAQTNDQFIVQKWTWILKGLKNKDARAFTHLKRLALERRDWEAVRDAEYFGLKVNFSVEKYLHLYFGSPFPEMRKRIEIELGPQLDRNIYVLGKKSAPRFDLTSATIDNMPSEISGGKCHQLMDALLLDFFRPLQTAGLFSKLYPEERFNVRSSPKRVQEIVRRTRRWLSAEKIPVEIAEDNGFYSLAILGDFSFRIPLERQPLTSASLNLLHLRQHFLNSPFSTEQARRRLGLSTASTQRLLNSAIQNGTVEKLGVSKRSAMYRILPRSAA